MWWAIICVYLCRLRMGRPWAGRLADIWVIAGLTTCLIAKQAQVLNHISMIHGRPENTIQRNGNPRTDSHRKRTHNSTAERSQMWRSLSMIDSCYFHHGVHGSTELAEGTELFYIIERTDRVTVYWLITPLALHKTARFDTKLCGSTQNCVVRHKTVRFDTKLRGSTQNCAVRHKTARLDTKLRGSTQNCAVRHKTVRFDTKLCGSTQNCAVRQQKMPGSPHPASISLHCYYPPPPPPVHKSRTHTLLIEINCLLVRLVHKKSSTNCRTSVFETNLLIIPFKSWYSYERLALFCNLLSLTDVSPSSWIRPSVVTVLVPHHCLWLTQTCISITVMMSLCHPSSPSKCPTSVPDRRRPVSVSPSSWV